MFFRALQALSNAEGEEWDPAKVLFWDVGHLRRRDAGAQGGNR